MSRRKHERYTKRIETEFSSGDMSFVGISSNLSEKGMFIRTQHGFVPGTTIDIKLRLPDDTISRVKAVVKRTVKTELHLVKNGMGVEIIESDTAYKRFVREELIGIPYEPSHAEEEVIVRNCPACGVKNRFRASNLHLGPKCGKCGSSLN